MIIENKEYKTPFKEIEVNDVFEYYDEFFLKTHQTNEGKYAFNAWNLSKAYFQYFSNDMQVRSCQGAKLII